MIHALGELLPTKDALSPTSRGHTLKILTAVTMLFLVLLVVQSPAAKNTVGVVSALVSISLCCGVIRFPERAGALRRMNAATVLGVVTVASLAQPSYAQSPGTAADFYSLRTLGTAAGAVLFGGLLFYGRCKGAGVRFSNARLLWISLVAGVGGLVMFWFTQVAGLDIRMSACAALGAAFGGGEYILTKAAKFGIPADETINAHDPAPKVGDVVPEEPK